MAESPQHSGAGSDTEKAGLGMRSDDKGRMIDGFPHKIEDLADTEVAVVELSDAEKKKVLRKLDWVLVPQLTLLYLLAFLDRSNSTLSPKRTGNNSADHTQLEMPKLPE